MATNIINEVVVPVLKDLRLPHLVENDEVTMGFAMTTGFVDLCIKEIRSPSLVWMAFDPHVGLIEEAGTDLALAINRSQWLLKVGRNPSDGQLGIDVEIPLRHGQLTKPAFIEYLSRAVTGVDAFLVLLAKVHWGGLTLQDALRAYTEPAQGARRPSRRSISEAERQAEEIIRRLSEVDYS